MSITIKIPDLESLPAVKLHHLPCNIGISGQANIDTYFSPEETETNGKTRTCGIEDLIILKSAPHEPKVSPVPAVPAEYKYCCTIMLNNALPY